MDRHDFAPRDSLSETFDLVGEDNDIASEQATQSDYREFREENEKYAMRSYRVVWLALLARLVESRKFGENYE